MLIQRIRCCYYTPQEAKRVKAISNLMVAYPVVYVVCTLPLASARMASMSNKPPSLERLCLSGAIITSNGWLDVLLYTLTRRMMIFSDDPPAEDNGIDTFNLLWSTSPNRFGANTIIEAEPAKNRSHHARKPTRVRAGRGLITLPSSSDSSENIYGLNDKDIKLVTTTHVISEPAEAADYEELDARRMRLKTPPGRWSEDSDAVKDVDLAPYLPSE
jgi:hypothetical protein